MGEDWETTGAGELDAGSPRRWVLGIVVIVEMNITGGPRGFSVWCTIATGGGRGLVAKCGKDIGGVRVGIA